jgi:hypothetical protein
MNIAATDRRAPHRSDRADDLARFFHPEAIADDPLHERARLAAQRFAEGGRMEPEDWIALAHEAAANAAPACVVPNF